MSSDLPETTAHPAPGKTARQHLLARSIWFTVPGTIAVIGVAYKLLPPLGGLEEPVARLMLATRWLVVAMPWRDGRRDWLRLEPSARG